MDYKCGQIVEKILILKQKFEKSIQISLWG